MIIQNLDTLYQSTFKKMNAARERQLFGQSQLLVGALREELEKLAQNLAITLLCKDSGCGSCQACNLLAKQSHPDCHNIFPEKPRSLLKIEQIRALQDLIYFPSQLGNNRVIIIYTADRMNNAAANAFLKILEEPPSSVYFILVAEQLSTILPTIVSRCQRWVFNSNSFATYMDIETFIELPKIIKELSDLQQSKISMHKVQESFAKYELLQFMKLLYSLTSLMIHYYFKPTEPSEIENLLSFARKFKPLSLFTQLDVIGSIIKKLNRGISLNQELTIDRVLIEYLAK